MYAGVDDDAHVVIVHIERDEAVIVDVVLVDEADDAGCRLTHVPVMVLEVLAVCFYRLETISPC